MTKKKHPPKMHTDLGIRKLALKPKQRLELPDLGAQGLYVCVQPSGAKSFAMRFRRPDGRNARLVLGNFDPTPRDPHPKDKLQIGASLTLVEARMLASRVHLERANGADVISDRKADKIKQRLQIAADQENDFTALARRYFEEHARHKQRRWAKWARYFGLVYREGQAEPTIIPNSLCDPRRWGARPTDKIGPADIKVVIDEAIRRAVPGLERKRETPRAEATGRTFQLRLSAFFSWCVDDMRIEANPCNKLRRPASPKSRDRVLSDDELVAVWKACDRLQPQYGAVAKLLILTGQRLREVGHMRWSELSVDLSTWSLPGSRTKNGRPHTVPLPPLSREIIKSVPRLSETFVFSLGGDEPLESYSRAKRKLDGLLTDVSAFTWHDLRRTLATNLQRLKVSLPVAEAILNHKSGSISGIAAVYQRHDYADEKRQALERWADRVEALVEGRSDTNVIDMRARKTALAV
jgi:integrase